MNEPRRLSSVLPALLGMSIAVLVALAVLRAAPSWLLVCAPHFNALGVPGRLLSALFVTLWYVAFGAPTLTVPLTRFLSERLRVHNARRGASWFLDLAGSLAIFTATYWALLTLGEHATGRPASTARTAVILLVSIVTFLLVPTWRYLTLRFFTEHPEDALIRRLVGHGLYRQAEFDESQVTLWNAPDSDERRVRLAKHRQLLRLLQRRDIDPHGRAEDELSAARLADLEREEALRRKLQELDRLGLEDEYARGKLLKDIEDLSPAEKKKSESIAVELRRRLKEAREIDRVRDELQIEAKERHDKKMAEASQEEHLQVEREYQRELAIINRLYREYVG